jgi:hypothetical protein
MKRECRTGLHQLTDIAYGAGYYHSSLPFHLLYARYTPRDVVAQIDERIVLEYICS